LTGTQFHTPPAARAIIEEKLPWALRPGFKLDDHDITINVWVRTTEDMLAIVMDPDFQTLVAGDDKTVDLTKATITAGWEEVYVENGKIVNVQDGESIYPAFAECVTVGSASKVTEAPADLEF
jgi:hypothetical protein